MSLKPLDLPVILTRSDPVARYQQLPEKQAHVRHQVAVQEQRVQGQREHQVQKPPRGEECRTARDGEEKKREQGPGKRVTRKKVKGKGTGDPLRGNRFDQRV